MSLEDIERKVASIREYIAILDSLKEDCLHRIKEDKIFRGSVLYYLYMMADSCIALAEMVIKHRQLPKPQSYFDAIDTLGKFNIIPDDFAYEFAKIAGFRKFLAHDYEEVDLEAICNILKEKP